MKTYHQIGRSYSIKDLIDNIKEHSMKFTGKFIIGTNDSYLKLETCHEEPELTYQDRVKLELKELQDKVTSLSEFIHKPSDIYIGLPEAEKKRLREQYRAMKAYEYTLADRINNF